MSREHVLASRRGLSCHVALADPCPFFMDCVFEAANDDAEAVARIFRLLSDDRWRILEHDTAIVSVLRLFELLPEHPMVTLHLATEQLGINKATAQRTPARYWNR